MLTKIIPRQCVVLPDKSSKLFIKYLLKNEPRDVDKVSKFEKEFAKYVGVRYAIATSSARVGLYLILNALGIGIADEVILSSYNSVIVPNILLILGIKPVFVDVDPQTHTMNPKLIEPKITERTRAVIVTHTEGQPCDMYPILKIAKKYGLKIIEDCAHAFGAEYKNKKVGSFGNAAIFSFGIGKHINTLGGGMLVTSDEKLAQIIRTQIDTFDNPSKTKLLKKNVLTNIVSFLTRPLIFGLFVYPLTVFANAFGKDIITSLFEERKIVTEIPKWHLTKYSNFQAIIGLKQLKSLEKNIERRVKNANLFDKYLSKKIKRQRKIPKTKSAYLNYSIQVKDRKKIIRELLIHGIDTQPTWMESCSSRTIFKSMADCPVSDVLEKSILYLPIYEALDGARILYIANTLNKLLVENA